MVKGCNDVYEEKRTERIDVCKEATQGTDENIK